MQLDKSLNYKLFYISNGTKQIQSTGEAKEWIPSHQDFIRLFTCVVFMHEKENPPVAYALLSKTNRPLLESYNE